MVDVVAKMGPDPVLLSRKEVDALYETMVAVVAALDKLEVDYIVTGGSLLGAVRQHSILFCDDDIDITMIDRELDDGGSAYERVRQNLASLLGDEFTYLVRPWEGGDKIRPKRMTSVFVDLFTLRRFETINDLTDLIGIKKNGQPQTQEYVSGIVQTIEKCAGVAEGGQGPSIPLCPFWHFNTRKAVEMWPKEVYREHELFPLCCDLKFGPITGVKGPRMPVLLLRRAFGVDCFEVYYQSGSHKNVKPARGAHKTDTTQGSDAKKEEQQQQSDLVDDKGLKPLVLGGGAWEGGRKAPLEEEHYVPMQSLSCAKRRPTLHGRQQLFSYLAEQEEREAAWSEEARGARRAVRPRRTVYMDGVFDLFHIGHLEAIQQCAELGDRVIIGVTGDEDAAGYKRPPIISQTNRVAIVEALREVDSVVCPCPLVVTEGFMAEHGIDLVVHGFANDADAKRQEEFFATPMRLGKFQRIRYYHGLSTTDIISKIRSMPAD